ncbi:ankyrin repeat domain-containing protein [Aspergillus lucknowensis]|uniref:Ankyrin repeat-containing domain protein n=1 Tax=Aspergillus lucknowensis TaxID=176173 RepID=A0ABR4LKX5_9EURO
MVVMRTFLSQQRCLFTKPETESDLHTKMEKGMLSDPPPHYSDIFAQTGRGETRPPSPAPSYHTTDVRDPPPPPELGPGAESTVSLPGRVRRVWRTWKDTGRLSTKVGENGYTVLHHAAQAGSTVNNLRRLVTESTLEIDVKTTSGWTPLHMAIVADKASTADRTQAFLQAGADPNLGGEKGWNALHLASAYGRKAVVTLLLGYPVPVDAVVGWEGSEGSTKEDANGHLTTLTAVELAARYGHTEIVTLLLDAGASPGSVDRTTVLHEAAGWGRAAVVSMLLEQQRPGLDGNWKDHRGFTALDCALSRDRSGTACVLMQQGEMVVTLLHREQNPQHPATLLHAMVRLGCGSVLAMLLAQPKYAKEVNTMNPNGLAPLHIATARGSVEILKRLLNHGADPYMADSSGWTPLHLAVRYGQADVVAALLQVVRWEEYQSRVSPAIAQGVTPIHIGILSGEMAIIRLLLRHGWPVDARCARGSTALHHASMSDQLDTVRVLLQQGADPLVRDQEQMTPLLLAAEAGHVQVMQQLLLREKDIQRHLPALAARKLPPAYEQILVPFLLKQHRDGLNELVDGRTVLHQAAQCGHTTIAKLMLQSGAQASVKDREGHTPVEVAATQGHLDLVYILDAEPFPQVERLIHHAVRQRNVNRVFKILTAAPKTLRRRVKAMALAAAALTLQKPLITKLTRTISIDEDQGLGWRPLYVATLKGEQRAMQLLLARGANPNLKTDAGITPLLQAAEGGSPNLIHLLLSHGASVEERDPRGHTALQVAARCGQGAAVVALLEAGADAHARDTRGQTALDLAMDRGAKDIVQSITDFLAQREKKQ